MCPRGGAPLPAPALLHAPQHSHPSAGRVKTTKCMGGGARREVLLVCLPGLLCQRGRGGCPLPTVTQLSREDLGLEPDGGLRAQTRQVRGSEAGPWMRRPRPTPSRLGEAERKDAGPAARASRFTSACASRLPGAGRFWNQSRLSGRSLLVVVLPVRPPPGSGPACSAAASSPFCCCLFCVWGGETESNTSVWQTR